MKAPIAPIAPIALIVALLGLGSMSAIAQDNSRQAVAQGSLGTPIADAPAGTKLVDVSRIKTLNINCGDVVTFQNGSRSFSWKFDVPNHTRVDLKAIAPADFKAPPVTVYVSRSESERS